MSIEFLMTSLVVVLLPGTGVIYTLACALGGGFRTGLYAAIGCTLGIVPHLLAAVIGLAAVLHASALAYQIVRAMGVAYLLYMAWGIWRDGGALNVTGDGAGKPLRHIVRDGFLLNILNPKLSLFFLAFLPQFVSPQTGTATNQMLVMGLAFMLMTLIVFVIYGAIAAWVRDYVVGQPRVMQWMRRGFAGAFAALGIRLALSDR